MLTDKAIKALAPRAALYRVTDADGLCIEVTPAGPKSPRGSKLWRFRYRYAGKAKMLALGEWPTVGLADARRRRDDARKLLADGRDPGGARKADKARAMLSAANTFGAIAGEWLAMQRAKLALVTITKAEWLLGMASPLDSLPMTDITAPDVLAVLRPIEAKGLHETARRVKQRIGQVFRYAIATGRAERDPTADLRGALTPVTTTARAAVTDPADVANLLRTIDTYGGQPVTLAALKLAPLLFARPGNLRAMEWAELDLDAAMWRIPAGKMKMREAHAVPLASQAVAILRELEPLTGRGRYCFPSLRTGDRPMSENTVNGALRRLGFDKDTMTGHGFRAMASTRLNEMGWKPDVIERQLAHAERNAVRAAYNRAQYMAERTLMMQAWADYLDGLRTGEKVLAFKRKPA